MIQCTKKSPVRGPKIDTYNFEIEKYLYFVYWRVFIHVHMSIEEAHFSIYSFELYGRIKHWQILSL